MCEHRVGVWQKTVQQLGDLEERHGAVRAEIHTSSNARLAKSNHTWLQQEEIYKN